MKIITAIIVVLWCSWPGVGLSASSAGLGENEGTSKQRVKTSSSENDEGKPTPAVGRTREDEVKARAEAPVRVVFTIGGRNGSPLLAAALVELQNLSQKQEYGSALKSNHTEVRNDICIAESRRDPSGKVFDLARCAHVWPQRGKAGEIQTFEDAYRQPVGQYGIEAFPAVKVSTFTRQERLKSFELGKIPQPNRKKVNAMGIIEPSPGTLKALCDPRYTFLPSSECEVRIIERPPTKGLDVYVSQTAYRIELQNEVPRWMAIKISDLVRMKVVQAATNKPDPAFSDIPRGVIDVAIVEATPSALKANTDFKQQALKDVSSRSAPPSTLAQEFARPWVNVNGKPAEVEIDATATVPRLLLFDDPVAQPSGFGSWYQDFRAAAASPVNNECELGEKPKWHTDAVASLFFPHTVQTLFSSDASSDSLPDFQWEGYILNNQHFEGAEPLRDGKSWSDNGVFRRDGGAPVIAVVVYTDEKVADGEQAALYKFSNLLSDPTRLLVVSSPQRASLSVARRTNYDLEPVEKITDKTVSLNCKDRAWPSCLGKHQRVLVVAPSDTDEDLDASRKPALYNPGEYLLGASTVRLAAPGSPMEVLSRCNLPMHGTEATRTSVNVLWKPHKQAGSSFAAPIVGLTLARIVGLGGPAVSQLPEKAIWRVLATADPIVPSKDASDPASLVTFGQINIGRALNGLVEQGEDAKAAIYWRRQIPDTRSNISYGVVLPYPWHDHYENIANPTQDTDLKPGIKRYARGILVYTEVDPENNGKISDPQWIDFKLVLRLTRKPGTESEENLWNLYYLDLIDKQGNYTVRMKSNIRLGVRENTPAAAAFCRPDRAAPASGTTKLTQAQPACLYLWDPKRSAGGFKALDLREIDDIVLPPTNVTAPFIGGIIPTDVKAVIRTTSPWRSEFCDVGPREAVKSLLNPSNLNITSLCKTAK